MRILTAHSPRTLPCPTDRRLPAAPSRVRPGDLWELGRHRLLCGDCARKEDVDFLMGGGRASLTVTSPPYNIGGKSNFPGNRHPGGSKYLHGGDALPAEEYGRLLDAFTRNSLAVSEVAVVNIQMLGANKVDVLEYLHRWRGSLIDVAVWDKGSAAPAMKRNVMSSRFELLLFLTSRRSKGRTPRTVPTADFRGTVENVYRGPGRKRNPYFRQHAATFPLHLPQWVIETFDSSGGIVFDPFLGTGTTLIACEQLERRCVGMEIAPSYCDLCLDRYERLTGTKATMIGSIAAGMLPMYAPMIPVEKSGSFSL